MILQTIRRILELFRLRITAVNFEYSHKYFKEWHCLEPKDIFCDIGLRVAQL